MSYWCDDERLNREQRRLDAAQAEARRALAADKLERQARAEREAAARLMPRPTEDEGR